MFFPYEIITFTMGRWPSFLVRGRILSGSLDVLLILSLILRDKHTEVSTLASITTFKRVNRLSKLKSHFSISIDGFNLLSNDFDRHEVILTQLKVAYVKL